MNNCAIQNLPVATACFAPTDFATTKPEYTLTACNAAFRELIGFDASGMEFSQISGSFSALFAAIAAHAVEETAQFDYFPENDKTLRFDVRQKRTNGEFIVCITDLRRSCCKETESKISRALQSISLGVITAGSNGAVSFLNPEAQRLTGWGDEALSQPLRTVLSIRHESGLSSIDVMEYAKNGEEHTAYGNDIVLRKKDGKHLNISLNVSPVDNTAGGIVVFFRDAGKDLSREKEILYLSYHDKLTGLYNRAYFEKKVKELDRPEHYPISMIIGDANGLKMTNDVFGHKQGDVLLITIANILSLACRESDTIARYGGDEFTVVMPNTSIEEAAKVCRNILSLCNDHSSESNKLSISLGYATKAASTENITDVLNIAEDFMYRHKLLESKSYRSSVISSLKNMLYEKSFETEEHAMRLTGLCNEAGILLGLSQSDLNDLELFSMLHDIGKIGVRDSVLLKPGSLSDEEWIEMRKHCEIGYRIAQSAPELAHIADYILCHHERFDGNGYPQGLKGKQIPILSRILAVADAYDAMVNDRYYRKAMRQKDAIEELKRCSGTQFDPEIVDVFLRILEPSPANLIVPAGQSA